MNLYELSESYQYILSLVQDEEADEKLLLDTLESIEGEIEDKADNYAKIIKSLEAEAQALKSEEDRLATRRRAREKNITLLKTRLEEAMRVTGKTKFKTDLFSFNIAKNGGKAPLKLDVGINDIPMEFFKHTEKELDNDLIRRSLDEGKINFAHYEERGESLRIK